MKKLLYIIFLLVLPLGAMERASKKQKASLGEENDQEKQLNDDLKEGLDDLIDESGRPLMYEKSRGYEEFAEGIVQSRNSKLIKAIENQDVKKTRRLLALGADANAQDAWGATALQLALHQRTEKDAMLLICEFLIEAGADINRCGTRLPAEGICGCLTSPPLIAAVAKGFYKVARLFIKKGADVNVQADSKETALIAAVRRREVSIEFCKQLLEAGADVQIAGPYDNNALQHATHSYKRAPLFVLGDTHIELRVQFIWRMLRKADEDLLRLLLWYNADPNDLEGDNLRSVQQNPQAYRELMSSPENPKMRSLLKYNNNEHKKKKNSILTALANREIGL